MGSPGYPEVGDQDLFYIDRSSGYDLLAARAPS
jgi:hypothetical protein